MVADVDAEERRLQGDQLLCRRDDDEVLRTKAGQHSGAELLVASPEEETLPPDDSEHEFGARGGFDQCDDRFLAQIAAEERPVQHRVDTERGAGEAQDLEDAPCRRAGAEEVKGAGHQFMRDSVANRLQHGLRGEEVGVLGAW